jgi:hypothetical protein
MFNPMALPFKGFNLRPPPIIEPSGTWSGAENMIINTSILY